MYFTVKQRNDSSIQLFLIFSLVFFQNQRHSLNTPQFIQVSGPKTQSPAPAGFHFYHDCKPIARLQTLPLFILEQLRDFHTLLPEVVNTFEFRLFPSGLHLITTINMLNRNYSIHQRLPCVCI